MLVNEPPSDDPKFFTGKALTYYGRWTYKYEEAARKGAVGAILSTRPKWPLWLGRRTQLEFRRKVYLGLDGTPKLKAAAWIQISVARNLAAPPVSISTR